MAMENKGKGYQHFFGQAPEDTKFKTDAKYEIVDKKNYDRIMSDIDQFKTISVDTETTGLSFISNHIVCASLATDPYNAYLFPFRHIAGSENNLPLECLKELWDLMLRKKVLFFNAVFDLLMFEYDKYLSKFKINAMDVSFFDVQVLTFNADTNYKPRNLKENARILLGRECPEFWEVLGNKVTFDYLSPSEGAYYACCDVMNTYGLYVKLKDYLSKECPFILKLDNELVKCFLHYAKQEITIDKPRMEALLKELKEEIKLTEKEIFKIVGYPFDCNSNRAVSQALTTLGVTTGVITKTGDMSVSAKLLEKVNHPVAKLITKRNSISTQISSYLEKLSKSDRGRLQYKLFHVPTGRLASGSEKSSSNKSNDYYLPLNYQNLTKPKPSIFKAIPSDSELAIMGYEFEAVNHDYMEANPNEFYVEGMDPHMNVRSAITVPDKKDWLFVSIDYSMEEIKIVAALSNEKNFLKPISEGADLHKSVAINMFGEANYTKEKRRLAKICLGDNSFVLTTRGYVRPRDLQSSDLLVNRFGSKLKYAMEVDRKQDMVVLEYSNGIVEEYKKGHKLLCWNGTELVWVEAEKIQDEQVLQVKSIQYETHDNWFIGGGIDVCSGLWPYVIGQMFRKGYVNSMNTQEVVFFVPKEVENTAMEFLKSEGLEVRLSTPKYFHSSIVVNSGFLIKWLKEVFEFTSHRKIIHPVILRRWGKKQLKDFLYGLTEGKYGCYEPYHTVTFNNRSIVALIHSIVGLGSRVTYSKGESYINELPDDETEDKSKMVQSWKNLNLNLSFMQEYRPVKVVSKMYQKGNSYAIMTLDDKHEYISSSFVSHNCNFGLLYGGSAFTLMSSSGVAKEVAEEMYNKFWDTMSTLRAWNKREVSKAYRNNGVVHSLFGRPRRLKYYLSSPDRKWRQYGERSVGSHWVQGSAGDIMRIDLINIYRKVIAKYPDQVKFIGCVHDEVNIAIRKEFINERVKDIKDIMEITIPGTNLVLTTSVEFGYSYGTTFPFIQDETGKWVPKPA